MASYRIAVVDDETPNLESLARILRSDGAEVFCYQDPREALEFLRENRVDILLTDLRMGPMDGIELLEAIRVLDSSIEVILMTAYGTVEIAVKAMKKGAYDFITKPLQRIQVIKSVHKALERRNLVTENSSLKEELNAHLNNGGSQLIWKSPAMKELMEVVDQTAHSHANVLIEGESGTGKGAISEYMHKTGMNSSGVFVKINCTAIPENLLEAELFGHETGAFTGATRQKKGRVELAHHGTLFLDEIGIAPLSLQAKLLRFLQEGEFERLGSNDTRKVKTRVISATNADLRASIREQKFREDLYYRLNVIHIQVPPLRDRGEDIPILAKKFIEDSAKKNGRTTPLLPAEAIECLCNYQWPGNVRELQYVMDRAVVLNKSGVLGLEDLPREVNKAQRSRTVVVPVGMPLKSVERMLMDETLKTTKGNKRVAAQLLGVHPRTIYRHLEAVEKTTEPTSLDEPECQ